MPINNHALCFLALASLCGNPTFAAAEDGHDHAGKLTIAEQVDEPDHDTEHQDKHGHEAENRIHTIKAVMVATFGG